MEIKIEDYTVLDNGTIITHENKCVIFDISPFKFRLVFKTDISIANSPINLELQEQDSSMSIVLTNYDSPLGQGLVRPINVATWNNKKLYIQLVVYSLNDSGTKIIHYTWLTKDKEDGSNHNK